MTKEEKLLYTEKKSVAYYSGYNGVEIKEILYGIDDYVVFVSGVWNGNSKLHKSKIHYESDRPYFRYGNQRIHWDECLRM